MTELQEAFENYACNMRVNLSAIINAAINETTDANGEIQIEIRRWDALHPSSTIYYKAVAPNQWLQRVSHQYRQQQNSNLPAQNYTFTSRQALCRQLHSLIRANVCSIYVISERTRHKYHTSDINLFK